MMGDQLEDEMRAQDAHEAEMVKRPSPSERWKHRRTGRIASVYVVGLYETGYIHYRYIAPAEAVLGKRRPRKTISQHMLEREFVLRFERVRGREVTRSDDGPWEGPAHLHHLHLGEKGPCGARGATIRWGLSGDHWMDFELFQVLVLLGHGKEPAYQLRNAMSSPNYTRDLDRAERLMHGFVKRDGCMQWWTDGEPLHADDWADAKAIGECILAVRRLAAEKIPAWDGEDQST